jgi:hypothetical protein
MEVQSNNYINSYQPLQISSDKPAPSLPFIPSSIYSSNLLHRTAKKSTESTMATAVLNNMDIVSATYGGSDYTAYLQTQLSNYVAPLGNTAMTWSIPVSNAFFGFDPNPGVLKAAVITYRYFLEQPSMEDKAAYYSPYQTVAGREGQTITISPAGRTFPTYILPGPTSSNEIIIAAYWLDKDVTAAVQTQWASLTGSPDLVNGTAITVSTDKLGPDPLNMTPKQCTVVLGRYINGSWYHDTRVDLQSPVSWTLRIPPAVPAILNRRINIYSAVWGGQDYTSYLRNRYFSDILGVTSSAGSVINDTQNVWKFSPNVNTLGPDPLPGTLKAFTIVYRIAAFQGTQDGHLIDPKAPPCWTEAWYDQQPPLLPTSQYPVLADVSDFRIATVLDGGSVTIDLAHTDMTPFSGLNQPFFVAATYHNIDVTTAAENHIATGQQGFPVSPQSFNVTDPAAGTRKQFAAAIAFPLAFQRGYQVRTIAALDGTSFSMPKTAPPLNPQWPQPYQPRVITFTDRGLANCWPQVYKNNSDTVQWCPRPSWGDIMAGNSGPWCLTPICKYSSELFIDMHTEPSTVESVNVDLITNAGCHDGDKVQLNFNVQSFDDPPKSEMYRVAANPTGTLEIRYGIDHKELTFFYAVGRGLQFLGEFIGLVLFSMG